MQGGYWCWDAPSCQARCSATNFACSSTGWQPVIAEEGLFSTLPDGAANPFASANKVFLKYCSSDSWLGDAGASSATFGYNFRGARIVAATIASLQALHGLGATPGQQLIFGGCSAGGRGAMGSLDEVAALLPGVNVRGFIDAAAWVDVDPAVPGLQTLQEQAALQTAFLQAPVPAACTAVYSGTEAWKCIWPSYRLPMVTTPFFLNAAAFDTFQIMYSTDNTPGTTAPGGVALLDSFQTATLALFNALPATTSIFSTSCLAHCLADSLELFCYAVNGVTLAQALGAWYADGTASRTIDGCMGWACTHACGPGPMATWIPENVPPTSTPLCAAYYASIGGTDAALTAAGASAPPQLGLGPTPAPQWQAGVNEDLAGQAATTASVPTAAPTPTAAPVVAAAAPVAAAPVVAAAAPVAAAPVVAAPMAAPVAATTTTPVATPAAAPAVAPRPAPAPGTVPSPAGSVSVTEPALTPKQQSLLSLLTLRW
jgi:hypothetical protein